MSIRRCMPGRPGVCTRSTRSSGAKATFPFSKGSFKSSCSILPGGSTVRTLRARISFKEDSWASTTLGFSIAAPRKLELARNHLVPGQLPARLVVAEVPSLSGQRLQGRASHWLRPDDDVVGCRGRTLSAFDPDFP